VIEVELGTPIDDVLARCGGVTEELQGILFGGYFGRWVPAQPGIRLSDESLGRYGAALGARAIVALPRSVCGLVETARVAAYMAGESAGQCGPCVFGLPALAAAVETLAQAKPAAGNALQRVSALRAQIARRGACAHPDGVLGFVSSALDVFDEEVQLHLAGRCSAHEHAPVLPIPVLPREWR
jgi:NADH:ubiquinone oxidoreductase subunit F (NADH-binding)